MPEGGDVEDLDAPVVGPPEAVGRQDPQRRPGRRWTRWPSGVPGWARGPVALLALVVAAGLAGGVVGASHRGAVDRETALARAVEVGYAFVGSQDLRGGRVRAGVTVSLLNHGTRPVDVLLQGFTTPHQGTAAVPDAVRLPAGASAPGQLSVDVDCSSAAQQDAEGTGERIDVDPTTGRRLTTAGGPTLLLASVRAADSPGSTSVDVRLPLLDDVAASLADQLAWACGGAAGPSGPQTGWLWLQDGGLRVSVANPSGAQGSVRLLLDASPGLAASARPSLPMDLGPGESVVLDLRVAPDCAVAGDGSGSWLELQAQGPQGVVRSLGRSSAAGWSVLSSPQAATSGTGQWLARRIALTCG